MAIALARDCIFPQDLEAAAHALNQELGDRFLELFDSLPAIEADVPTLSQLLDLANDKLSQLLTLGDQSSELRTLEDISTSFGLMQDPSTQLTNEQFLSYSGLYQVDGILYVPGEFSPVEGDINNIEVLRKLYFAAGRDLSRVELLLQRAKPVVTHSTQTVSTVPKYNSVAPSTDEIKSYLNIAYLDEDNVADAGSQVVVIQQNYLSESLSLDETTRRFGLVSADLIVSSIFHFSSIDNSVSGIRYFQNLGYTGSELGAIFVGKDLVDTASSPLPDLINTAKQQATAIITVIDFVLDRYTTLSTTNQNILQTRILDLLNSLEDFHVQILAKAHFEVSIILQRNTLTQLRSKHSDTQIKTLLEERDEIEGIYFDAPDDIQQQVLTQSLSVAVGSTLISNRFLNSQTVPTVQQDVLVQMLGYIINATEKTTSFSVKDLNLAREALLNYAAAQPITTQPATTTPEQGQPSAATPSSVISQYLDPYVSFDIKVRLGPIDDALDALIKFYTESIARPLARILNIISGFFEVAFRSIQQIINKAKRVILPLKNRLDAFMSRYLSLIGSGTFNSSLLKCAINFNIGLSTPILDDLLALMDELSNIANRFLTKLADLFNGITSKILCLPLGLINSFLGDVESNLPSICQLPRINLGSDLDAALQRLRNSTNMYNDVLTTFSSDLIQYKAVITGAPDRLSQFSATSSCSSPNVSTFFNAAILNIGGAIGNPIGKIF